MKIQKKDIPESMKDTIKEVSTKSKEQDTNTILKDIAKEESARRRDNNRATFFVNLIYLMSLALSIAMIYKGLILYAIPSLTFVTLGALVFNIFIYIESKRTKKHQEAIQKFYTNYGHKEAN